jgi:protein-histidine pros-kinase
MRHDKQSDSAPAVEGHLPAIGHAKPAAAPRISQVRQAPADLFELFGVLIEAMPDAIVVSTQAGTIVLVNAETERLFGYGRSDLIGQPVEIFVPERFRVAHRGHRAGYFRAASLRPMGSGMDLYAVRRDGHEFPVEISLSPIQTRGGTLVISAIRDVTVQRAAQRATERAKATDMREANAHLVVGTVRAQQLTEEAEEANHLKDEFLATVSHELRTPLNAILGWQRMMELKQLPPERAAHAVAAIGRSASALANMVDDLLDASRIVKGTIRLALEPVDLAAVTQAALETLRPLAANRNVQLALEGAPDDRTINGDAGRLQQVIWNLVSNAIKFTLAGGRVDVAMSA